MSSRRHTVHVVAWCACLALAACESRPAGQDGRVPVERTDATLAAVSPAGRADVPLVFRWAGGTDEGVVRVTIVDEAERTIVQFDARGHQAPLPAGYEDTLPRGETLAWRVSGFSPSGDLRESSALVRFSLPPAPAVEP